MPVALGRAALSACVAASMAARLFIADITIVASLFGVAVGEGDTGPRASISRRSRHGCATEVSLTYHGARDLGPPAKG